MKNKTLIAPEMLNKSQRGFFINVKYIHSINNQAYNNDLPFVTGL